MSETTFTAEILSGMKPYQRHIPHIENLPESLAKKPYWVVWITIKNSKGGVDKIPVSANPKLLGSRKWSNPDFCTTADQAIAYATRRKDIAGIGVLLRDGFGIAGGDIDNCFNPTTGELSDTAQAILEETNTYTEISPGLCGLRFIAWGDFGGVSFNDSQGTGLEIYEKGRFLTITGFHFPGTPKDVQIRDLSDFAKKWKAKVDKKPQATTPAQTQPHEEAGIYTLDEVLPWLKNNNADYDTWLTVGMGIHAAGGTYEDWLNYSRQSEKHDKKEMQKKWDSFKPTLDGVTLGTLVHMAKQKGMPSKVRADFHSIELSEPLPLPDLPPVPDLPTKILPDAMQAWVDDAATRASFSPDFMAVGGMVAFGSIIGRRVGIRLKQRDDWTEYANTWGQIVGPPSAMKSPAMGDALRPLKKLQVRADGLYDDVLKEYKSEVEEYEMRRAARKKKVNKELEKNPDAPVNLGPDFEKEEPTPPTYWTSNVNEASLGALLQINSDGLLIVRDELSSLLVSLEKDEKSDLRGMLLSGWSGSEGYRFDRIGRGIIQIPAYALSLLGGIQPGPLARYVRSAASGEHADGLLQRFQLATWPDLPPFEDRDEYPDSEAKRAVNALFDVVDHMKPEDIGQRDDFSPTYYVRLSDEAQEIFSDWYRRFMRSLRSKEQSESISGPLAAHFGKYPGLVGKLALNLHVADNPGGGVVSKITLLKALGWIEYLEPHARRIYHAVDKPETGAAALLLARLKRGELPPKFKPWEIARKCWHGLGDSEVVKKACRLLFEFGWLVVMDSGGATGGRPADPVYSVSPLVRASI